MFVLFKKFGALNLVLLCLLKLANATPGENRGGNGPRDRDDIGASRYRCGNFGAIEACRNRYRSREGEVRATLAALSNRAQDLRNALVAIEPVIARDEAAFSGINEQLNAARQTAQTQRDLLNSIHLNIAKVDELRNSWNELQSVLGPRVPAVVQMLVQQIRGTDGSISQRIQQINSELTSSSFDESRAQSLQFEKARLEELSLFFMTPRTPDEMETFIQPLISNPSSVTPEFIQQNHLNGLGVALLSQALQVYRGVVVATDVSNGMGIRLESMRLSFAALEGQADGVLGGYLRNVTALEARRYSLEQQYNASREQRRRDNEELNQGNPHDVAQYTVELGFVGIFIHCCDNAPYCGAWEQGFASYESLIRSQPGAPHVPHCFEGRE